MRNGKRERRKRRERGKGRVIPGRETSEEGEIEKTETSNTFNTVVNIAKRSGLFTITPHLELASGNDGLAGKGSGSLNRKCYY